MDEYELMDCVIVVFQAMYKQYLPLVVVVGVGLVILLVLWYR